MIKPYTFTEIKNESGETILTGRDSDTTWEAIKPEPAAMMNRYLNSVVTSGTGRGAALSDGTCRPPEKQVQHQKTLTDGLSAILHIM